MDQQHKEEEDHSKEYADHHKEEEQEGQHEEEEKEDQHKKGEDQHKKGEEQDNSEESMDGCTEEKKPSEEDQRKAEDYEEAAMAAWPLFAYPCSLLQYVIRAWACRLGLHYSFGDPKPSDAAPPAPPADSPSERGVEDTKTTSGFYIQEVITRVRAVRPHPPSNKPREGGGGNGGQHN